MQLPGPAMGAPKQVIAALEDRKCIPLFPHVDSQGEVERRGDDSALVLEMRSYMRPDAGSGGRFLNQGRMVQHSPHTAT